ncbi:MAG TPA: energy transducer TonB [Stellaceae bacterium]|nr:energy transducer TonB [Stellaceae bacterium]
MSRPFGLPVAASVAGHVAVVALMILVAKSLPPVALRLPAPKPIEIMLAPPPVAAPPPEPAPIPAAEPPPPVVKPGPPPPIVKSEPPPPPPPPKPALKPPPLKPPPHQPPQHPVLTQPPTQTAVVPLPAPPRPPPPAPVVSASYRIALSVWLESHKRYPESARERGEEGRAVLRFHVDRSGRVLDYAIVQSTGHPDLDAALDRMMRGASLPPFPADMTEPDVEVTVAVRFALAR